MQKEVKNMNVQALINNISFPKTIEELEYFVKDVGHFNVEDILYYPTVEWTMPKWALTNDIVFFFHAKTAIQIIRGLESGLKKNREQYDYDVLMEGLSHSRELYHKYGGKIFAVGRVLGRPYYDDGEWQEDLHWRGKIYAEIGDIQILQNPVDIKEFSDFIMISRQSAITSVVGDDFEKLKNVILKTNELPTYLVNSKATPLPLNKINSENWMRLTQEYRRTFFLEIQFRKFYVDYLLLAIADKKKVFSECACYKNNKLEGYADNCIWFNGKLCFVEVKLNFDAERNFVEQLIKYSNVESALVKKEKRYADCIEQKYVIVVDTRRIGVFDARLKSISIIADLDLLQSKSDLVVLRHKIIDFMENANTNN
ncbi:MAG: hypothetical protein ACI4D0_03720 [Lachnospira sp.]